MKIYYFNSNFIMNQNRLPQKRFLPSLAAPLSSLCSNYKYEYNFFSPESYIIGRIILIVLFPQLYEVGLWDVILIEIFLEVYNVTNRN